MEPSRKSLIFSLSQNVFIFDYLTFIFYRYRRGHSCPARVSCVQQSSADSKSLKSRKEKIRSMTSLLRLRMLPGILCACPHRSLAASLAAHMLNDLEDRHQTSNTFFLKHKQIKKDLRHIPCVFLKCYLQFKIHEIL